MEETVYEFPNLQKLFNDLDKKARYFRRKQETENYNKEMLLRKKDALLATAQDIGMHDLMMLYYVKRLDRVAAHKMLRLLKEMYHAKMELQNTLQVEGTLKDDVNP